MFIAGFSTVRPTGTSRPPPPTRSSGTVRPTRTSRPPPPTRSSGTVRPTRTRFGPGPTPVSFCGILYCHWFFLITELRLTCQRIC